MAVESFLNIENLQLAGTSVFLRLDLNVPLKDGKIIDPSRILAALPTIDYLLERSCKIVVGSHLGRPSHSRGSDRSSLSLEPVAQFLNQRGYEVLLMDSPESDAPAKLVKDLKGRQLILLENLRFSKGEEVNSHKLASRWARYCDVYINDAFGCSHRAHASIDALARLKPIRCYGPLIQKELAALERVMDSPASPFSLVVGGSKVTDKLPVVDAFADAVDFLLIGGAMAYTFLRGMDVNVGRSKIETEKVGLARQFLKRMEQRGKSVLLPVDHVTVKNMGDTEFFVTSGASIPADEIAVDIGPKTVALFSKVIRESKTVFWNGPMGMYETPPFDKGSLGVAQAMSESQGFSVVGGGDSGAVVVQGGYQKSVSHVSTGGGASMEYLCGKSLPGLEVLKVRTIA